MDEDEDEVRLDLFNIISTANNTTIFRNLERLLLTIEGAVSHLG